jgi:hypothetical protein
LAEREKALNESLALINDSINKLRVGEKNYLKVLAGQLRALIATGSRSLNPLLLDLADEKNITLKCYAPPTDELLDILGDKTVLLIDPRYAVSYKHDVGLKEFEFKKWLNKPYLVMYRFRYTPNEVIRMFAEKEGGTSFDDKLPEKLVELRGVIYGKADKGINEIEKLLLQTGIVVLHFGDLILTNKT